MYENVLSGELNVEREQNIKTLAVQVELVTGRRKTTGWAGHSQSWMGAKAVIALIKFGVPLKAVTLEFGDMTNEEQALNVLPVRNNPAAIIPAIIIPVGKPNSMLVP